MGFITRYFHPITAWQRSQTNRCGLYTLFLISKTLCMQRINFVYVLLTIQIALPRSLRFGGGHIGWSQLLYQFHHCAYDEIISLITIHGICCIQNLSLPLTTYCCIKTSAFTYHYSQYIILQKKQTLRYWRFRSIWQIGFNTNCQSHQIATNFGTCHDSTAVAPCTKFCSDHSIGIEMRGKRNFHRIWIAMEKPLVNKCSSVYHNAEWQMTHNITVKSLILDAPNPQT